MQSWSRLLPLITASVLAVACGGKAAPEQPAPQPTTTAAPPPPPPAPPPAPPAASTTATPTRSAADEAAAAAARNTATALEQLAAVIHFDFDKAEIQPEDRANMDRKAAILRANGAVRLRVSGHADERGSDEYNLALGNRRAIAAKQHLVNQGISPDRLETVSYGEERALNPGHDEAAWAQNRRDEFEVTAGASNLMLP
jgi:peptidoglycan-associated lipoprotein